MRRALASILRTAKGFKDPAIRKIWTGQVQLGSRVCIFSHYDPKGLIGPPVLHYLEQLQACGFSTVLVSTSPTLESTSRAKAEQLTHALILRDNIGLDFASWRAGCAQFVELSGLDGLLFANDSVFGPLHPLEGLFARMDAKPDTVWGMTSSYERSYHLQSYFLYFPKQVCRGSFLSQFVGAIELLTDKEDIINRYEIGVSAAALAADVPIEALFPYEQTKARAAELGANFQYQDQLTANPLNTTLFMWDLLIEDFKFPFLKSELLKQNRFDAKRMRQWRDILGHCPHDIGQQISEYLQRSYPNAAITS